MVNDKAPLADSCLVMWQQMMQIASSTDIEQMANVGEQEY